MLEDTARLDNAFAKQYFDLSLIQKLQEMKDPASSCLNYSSKRVSRNLKDLKDESLKPLQTETTENA